MIIGVTEASQDISFPAMAERHAGCSSNTVLKDPAVASVGTHDRPGGPDGDAEQRPHVHRAEARGRARRERRRGDRPVRPELAKLQGITLYMQAAQDITIGAGCRERSTSIR